MASAEITIFLKNLAGDTIIVEKFDPYQDNDEIKWFLRRVVHSVFPEEFPDLQSVKFVRDEKDASDLSHPPLQEGEFVMFFVDYPFESKILKKIQNS